MIRGMIATVGAIGTLVLVLLMAIAFVRSCHNPTPYETRPERAELNEEAPQQQRALPATSEARPPWE